MEIYLSDRWVVRYMNGPFDYRGDWIYMDATYRSEEEAQAVTEECRLLGNYTQVLRSVRWEIVQEDSDGGEWP